MVGEQIGFDEGGVFQALSDPIYTRTTTKYTYNQKGLVSTETTTVTNITGAHVLAACLGPALIALFIVTKDLDPKTKAAVVAASPAGIAGMAAAYALAEAAGVAGEKAGGLIDPSKIGTGAHARSFADWLLDLTK